MPRYTAACSVVIRDDRGGCVGSSSGLLSRGSLLMPRNVHLRKLGGRRAANLRIGGGRFRWRAPWARPDSYVTVCDRRSFIALRMGITVSFPRSQPLHALYLVWVPAFPLFSRHIVTALGTPVAPSIRWSATKSSSKTTRHSLPQRSPPRAESSVEGTGCGDRFSSQESRPL